MKETKGYLDMELLRFTTAGSVDDGKSTLIGRLLYDSKAIFEDQMDILEETSKQRGEESINLALLTDGLRSEREQGITIDVAYRYFATPKRKFIIADTPGHIQYTRNMVTGASTANLALLLIDARHGVIEQTKRHAFIASLLQIPHIAVCVNKMDLVDYSKESFDKIGGSSPVCRFTFGSGGYAPLTSGPLSSDSYSEKRRLCPGEKPCPEIRGRRSENQTDCRDLRQGSCRPGILGLRRQDSWWRENRDHRAFHTE